VFFGSNLTNVAGTLYFTTGTSVWRSDGTPAGTVPVGDFHPVSGQYSPNQLTAAGGRLFFAAKEPDGSDVKLWTTDGMHLEALRALDAFQSNQLTSAAGRLFFVANDLEHGRELWTSDGTVDGTQLVRDINPGPGSSSPSALSAAAGRLLLRACDAHGCRLWESNGTEAGTRPLADLDGLVPSTRVVTAGSLAFFAATDSAYGAELRAASLSAVACIGDCDDDGASTVDELLTMINIALGRTEVSLCLAGDANADGRITIDEILTAVNNALTGCPGRSAPRR
jgi:ELWxxDGT repeat protein